MSESCGKADFSSIVFEHVVNMSKYFEQLFPLHITGNLVSKIFAKIYRHWKLNSSHQRVSVTHSHYIFFIY